MDITSLARRFEIPRDALNGIKNIADEGERFAELQKVLANYGITTELLGAQANSTAVVYDKLVGSAKDFGAGIGQLLGTILAPFAEKLGEDLKKSVDQVNTAKTNIDTLLNQGDQLAGFNARIFAGTEGYDAYIAKIREVNAEIPFWMQHIQELTPAQYEFASSLVTTGQSWEEASAKAASFSELIDKTSRAFSITHVEATATAESLQAFSAAQLNAANASAEGATFAYQVAVAVATHRISVEQGIVALDQFTAGMEANAAAQANNNAVTEQATLGVQLFTDATTASALENVNAAIQADALKLKQEQLYAAALAAAQGMGATAQSAAALAGQFGVTTAEAYNLISALQQLQVAQAKKDSGMSPRDYDSNAEFLAAVKDAEAKEKAWQAQQKFNYSVADTAGKLSIARDELRKTQKGTEDYWNALSKVSGLEKQLANENKPKKGGSGAPKLTPNEKINTKLLDDLDKYNNKFEDAEQKHYDKLASIQEEYEKKTAEQMAKNEVSKRRSRADFYTGLQEDAAKGIDVGAFAAQYEEAFAQAQKIAQEGKAKLANEFLELRQKQIEEMKGLAEEEAKIKEERKSGKISKKEEQDQLAYLEGRRKLIEDAQREEQQQLLAAGDENQNRLKEQLDAENQAYADQADKIATQAGRAADAKIAHAERSKIAVSEENKELAKQAGIYDEIAAKNGGKVPTPLTSTANKDTAPANTEDSKPLDVSASSPIPVETPDALLVRQAEMFIVHDQDVINTIGDMAARLEGKLGEVVGAVNSAKDSISGAVRSVESAVGRIKINVTSAVTG